MSEAKGGFSNNVGIIICLVFGLLGGYGSGIQPSGAGWRFFSYHPFLMTMGFVGLMGAAAHKKKLGGYTNTKMHGMIASLAVLLSIGGMYVIYTNKEIHGKAHLTSVHSLAGIITIAGCILAMIPGAVFLHPDFGTQRGNKSIRFAHKWFSRFMIASGWMTCFMGLQQLTNDKLTLAMYGLPLLLLAPLTLI